MLVANRVAESFQESVTAGTKQAVDPIDMFPLYNHTDGMVTIAYKDMFFRPWLDMKKSQSIAELKFWFSKVEEGDPELKSLIDIRAQVKDKIRPLQEEIKKRNSQVQKKDLN
jgi:hypothetical protein